MSQDPHLSLLLKVSEILHSNRGLPEALTELLQEVISTLDADRGFVVLERDGKLELVASYRMPQSEVPKNSSYSTTVAWKVIREGEPVLAVDAAKQYSTPSVTISAINSILVAPIAWRGAVRGALYIDSRCSRGVFRQEQSDLLMGISQQAAKSLEAAVLYEFLQQSHRNSGGVPETLEQMLQFLRDPNLLVSQPYVQVPPTAACRVYLFGELRVELGAPVVPWKSRKDRELFAYLALNKGQLIHEERLAEIFWPQAKRPRHSLQNSITQIRKVLGDKEALQRRQEAYVLSTEIWTDYGAFVEALRKGKQAAENDDWEKALFSLREAEVLAKRELLQGMQGEYLESFRLRVAEALVKCQSLQAEHFSQRGKHLMAVELWKRILEIDSCHDHAYEQLIKSLLHLGRKTDAQKTYSQAQESYRRDLEMEAPESLNQILSESF